MEEEKTSDINDLSALNQLSEQVTFSSTPQIEANFNPAFENKPEILPVPIEATNTETASTIPDQVGLASLNPPATNESFGSNGILALTSPSLKEEKTKLARKRLQDEMGKYISRYDDLIAARLLNEIRNGKLCKPACVELGISPGNVYWWADSHPEFGEALHKAKLHCAHSLVDDCLEIIDASKQDEESPGHKDLYHNDKILAVNNAAPHRDRERVNYRKWLAGKYNPMYLDDAGSINIGVQVNGLDMPRTESRTEWIAAKLVEQGTVTVNESLTV